MNPYDSPLSPYAEPLSYRPPPAAALWVWDAALALGSVCGVPVLPVLLLGAFLYGLPQVASAASWAVHRAWAVAFFAGSDT